jgi:hypothetical protein
MSAMGASARTQRGLTPTIGEMGLITRSRVAKPSGRSGGVLYELSTDAYNG